MFRLFTSLALAVTLLLGTTAAAADKPVKGNIVKVEKNNDQVMINVSVTEKKKKKDAAATETKTEKKYTLPASTKVEKLVGKKDSITRSDAKLDELKEGQMVTLTVNGDKVEKIEFHAAKKNK